MLALLLVLTGRVLGAVVYTGTYSPYLTKDSHFPQRPGVHRADIGFLQDAPCTIQEPCCRKGSEFVIEKRFLPSGLEYSAAFCLQCLPGWFANRLQQWKFTPSFPAVDPVQEVKCIGTSGTFTLTQDGKTTTPIDFDESAVNVKAALKAAGILPNAGTVTYTEAKAMVPATDTTPMVPASPQQTSACTATGLNTMKITFVGVGAPRTLFTSNVAPVSSTPLTNGVITHTQTTRGKAAVEGGDPYTDELPTCTRCPHGKYGTPHRHNCTSCLSNEHTNQHTRLGRADCLVCATGEYYAWKEGCFGCWPNFFCPNGFNRTLCPNGTKSEARQTVCVPIPRIGFDDVIPPPPDALTPCTSQQQRADLGCRAHGEFNKYQCEASTSNIRQIRTNRSNDHDSKTEMFGVQCMWCPAFNDSGVIADRCLAKQLCKAAVGKSSCWDGFSSAPAARSPGALALMLTLTLTLTSACVSLRQGQ